MIVNGERWLYKSKMDYYAARDRAFIALLYLTKGRVSEVCKVRKDQFDFGESDFVLIRDFEIHKRKKKTLQAEGVPKRDIPLPLTGALEKFTKMVLNYYDLCETKRLFTFGRRHALRIVKYVTGKWCHYFRSQGFSDIINRQKVGVFSVARIYGVKNPSTLTHYDKGEWEEHRKELKR